MYELDEDGNRIRDQNGEFVFNAVPTTDWGSPETLEPVSYTHLDVYKRQELQDITAYLRTRAEAPKDRMPKLPVKIRRKEKVL